MKKAIGRRQFLGTTVALGASTRLNAAPNGNIGRGMKVGKEEIIALVVALEAYVKRDHDQTFVRGTRERGGWQTSSRTCRD